MTTEQRCPVCGVDEKYATDGSCAKCYPPSRRMTTEQGAPEAGAWKTVPRKPTPVQLEQAASNLADEFGVDFVLANEQFALAVYDEMLAASPSPPPGVGDGSAPGQESFTQYFVKNYPGPDTIIYDPKWHAPKIYRAAIHAFKNAAPPVGGEVVNLEDDGLEKERRNPRLPIGDYPIGTKAHAISGGYWIRVKNGWKWFCGATFPRYGADAWQVELPLVPSSASLLKEAWKPIAAQAEHLAIGVACRAPDVTDATKELLRLLQEFDAKLGVSSYPSLLEEVGEALRASRRAWKDYGRENDPAIDVPTHHRDLLDKIDAVIAKLGVSS